MIHGSSRRLLQFIAASFGVGGYRNRFLRSIMNVIQHLLNHSSQKKNMKPPLKFSLSHQDFSLFFVFLVPLRVSKNSCSATGDGLKRPPTLPFTHHAHRGTRLYPGFPTNHRSSVCVAYNCCFRPKPTTSFKFFNF